MKYDIPEDRLPRPALPTPEDALAAIQGTISQVVGENWKPIIQQAVAELIFTDLVEPLLTLATTWQERAVFRREVHAELVRKWSGIRALVLEIATPDEVGQSLSDGVGVMRREDNVLPPPFESLDLVDLDTLTPDQVDELHTRHAHPHYEYATTEGPRKQWDCTPPEGDGWELNKTKADPEAWERFDYIEEAYWRRLKPQPEAEALEPGDDVLEEAHPW